MKNSIITAAVAALGLSPLAASADEVSYSYVEIKYVDVELDAGALGGGSDSGFGLAGSYAINDMFHVVLDHSSVGDVDQTAFGVGYHREVGEDSSLYVDLNYESVDAGALFDDSGYSVVLGLRGSVADSFELEGYVGQVDIADSETVFGVEARYAFNDQMAIGLGFEWTEFSGAGDVDTLELGFRYHF